MASSTPSTPHRASCRTADFREAVQRQRARLSLPTPASDILPRAKRKSAFTADSLSCLQEVGAMHAVLRESHAAYVLDEALGGMAEAVASGMPKRRIEEAAARKQARIDGGSDVIVGINKFTPDPGREQPTPELRVIDNSAVREQQAATQPTKRAGGGGKKERRAWRGRALASPVPGRPFQGRGTRPGRPRRRTRRGHYG